MNARNIKRQALYLAIGALGCFLVWKVAPIVGKSDFVTRPTRTDENVTPGPNPPPGSVLVNVNMIGFDPASIPATPGQPLKLAFYRPTPSNCTREVVFPSLGIRKELPPGETVVIDITPQKSGRLAFECGMKMLKGQVVVQ